MMGMLSDTDEIEALVRERSGQDFWEIDDAIRYASATGLEEFRAVVVGDTLVLGAVVHDDDPSEDFWDTADGLGTLYSIDGAGEDGYYRRHEKLSAKIAALREDRVPFVMVECYEHSQVHYSVVGTGNYPDRMWDVGVRGVYVPCEDVQAAYHKAKYRKGGSEAAMKAVVKDANAILDEFSKYVNGDVWGTSVVNVDLNTGEASDDDSCWGFIGSDSAVEALEETVEGHVFSLKRLVA
jgi:hypothetical protein